METVLRPKFLLRNMAFGDSFLNTLRCVVTACDAIAPAPVANLEKKDPLRQPWKVPLAQAIQESETLIEARMVDYERCVNAHKDSIRPRDNCKEHVEKLEKEQARLKEFSSSLDNSRSFNYKPDHVN